MRVTVPNTRSKADAIDAVNRSIGQLLTGVAVGPVSFSDVQKKWTGDRMDFTLNAKMGPVKTPIQGWVEVTAAEVTIDVDLGILGNLIPQGVARAQVENRIKGLLT